MAATTIAAITAGIQTFKTATDSIKAVRDIIATWKDLDKQAQQLDFRKEIIRLEAELLNAQAQTDRFKERVDEIEKAWHTRGNATRTEYGCYLVDGEKIPYCGRCLDEKHKHYQVNKTGMQLWCAVCGTKYHPPFQTGRMRTPYE